MSVSEKMFEEAKGYYPLMLVDVLTINIPILQSFVLVERRAFGMSRKSVQLNVKCESTLLSSFLYLDLLTCAPTLQHFISFISTSINI